MKYGFGVIYKFFQRVVLGVWDFFFLFLGVPYEEQAKRLKLDDLEPTFWGPENEKTTHQFYRANKVSNDTKEK